MKSYEPTDLDRYITFFSAGLVFFGVTANGAGNIPDRDPYCKKLHWLPARNMPIWFLDLSFQLAEMLQKNNYV